MERQEPACRLILSMQISSLGSVLQSAQGTLRALLEGSGGRKEGVQQSAPPSVPQRRKPVDDKEPPSTVKGPRRMDEPCGRVPGAAWSLSQVVSNAASHAAHTAVTAVEK